MLDRSGRSKLNTVDDRNFYAMPRLCTHVDDAFLGQLTELKRLDGELDKGRENPAEVEELLREHRRAEVRVSAGA